MLSPHQQRLVKNFLITQQRAQQQQDPTQEEDVIALRARNEHDSVEDEVARQRDQYTETGQSDREKELLANMGRLEDQLEGYRRLGPNLREHLAVQEKNAKSLRELEAKAHNIEEMAATLWWDSKLLMCAVFVF